MDFKQNLCAALSNACGMTAEQIGDMLKIRQPRNG